MSTILLMGETLAINAYAFSGELDVYSGWCGQGGLTAVDTFYNDDWEFFLDHTITDITDGPGSKMAIYAQQSTIAGYRTNKGRSTVYMYSLKENID